MYIPVSSSKDNPGNPGKSTANTWREHPHCTSSANLPAGVTTEPQLLLFPLSLKVFKLVQSHFNQLKIVQTAALENRSARIQA